MTKKGTNKVKAVLVQKALVVLTMMEFCYLLFLLEKSLFF